METATFDGASKKECVLTAGAYSFLELSAGTTKKQVPCEC